MAILIAHRGDSMSFPENTLEAFLSAFEKGAKGIELDIQLHDDEIIIVHNYQFNRKRTFPKLKDVLRFIHTKGRIEIEVKAFSPDILTVLQPLLCLYPQCDFELTTSEIPLAPYIKKSFPNIPLGLIFHNFYFHDWMTQEIVQQKMIGWGKMVEADRIHLLYETLEKFGKERLVRALHEAGFLVHAHVYHTNYEKKQLADYIRWHIDQCTVDNIALLHAQ